MEPLHPTDPPHISEYKLTARLGTGGMGQVYLARTTSGRQLVVKVIRPELANETGFRARFAREAEAARRVGGFHTAQIIDADPHADAPWIATAHIPGPTLTEAVRENGPITPPALHVLATGLAEGLKAVHSCDLVHRDLKPGNIILADDGPRIIDFGIARPLDADSMTTHGAIFGTLPYMSPEQTDGSRVGPASDLFSLGTVLAYAATGTNPFNGATMAQTLRRLISPPPDPGDIDPATRDLITACWNHDPTQRPTPEQILARFADHDLHDSWPPPQPTTPSRPEPAIRPLPTPPIPTRSKEESSPAPREPRVTPPAATKTKREGDAVPQRAEAQSPPPNAGKTSLAKATPLTKARPDQHRGKRKVRASWFYGISAVIAAVVLLSWYISNPRLGESGASEPGMGKSEADEFSTSESSALLPTSITRIGYGDAYSVAFSPDSTTVATGRTDSTAELWDVTTGELITTITSNESSMPGNNTILSVAFSPDGFIIATGNSFGTAQLWDANTGEPITTITGHDEAVYALAFSPDSTTIAVGMEYGSSTSDNVVAQLLDTETGDLITTLTGHNGSVVSVAFSPDGTALATSSADGTARLWDANTGEPITTITGHDEAVSAVAFSPDSATLATGSTDGTTRLWDTESGDLITSLDDYGSRVRSVAFSPDGALLATASTNTDRSGSVRIWELN
ncbi:WD40 repeat domain-containing serine/threonine protein kinase [Nocardiopsis sp. FIRDI 009]|uniref:WD40 repeat domain-containing serine/threonine protein kinase n=1 Tax=Nocardiopsis sp. FIRDI 009 TaxID=714197 RepID=UPI000E27E7AF|nr:serine/threonine-protein kinase [Nocardiopsis sp. FIRDI 009]